MVVEFESISGNGWRTWTPTFASGVTLGNGTFPFAKYVVIGKTVIARFSFVLGSSSSITGNVIVNLPVTAASTYSILTPIGIVRHQTAGAGYDGSIEWESTTTAQIIAKNSAGTNLSLVALSGTVPATWVTGDSISCQFMYEAA